MNPLPPPRENPTLLGHNQAEAQLLQAWAGERLPHGWLISGPKGVGKMTLACRFARFVLANQSSHGSSEATLFADTRPDPPKSLAVDPEHPVFIRVSAGAHADLHILERNVVNGRMQSAILVDAVRSACRSMSLTSAEGGWRIIIIDDADTMNENAFNALLKVLEEPPERALLILVAHASGRMPATLRSRCCEIRLFPLSEEVLFGALKTCCPELDEVGLRELSGLSDGSIGQALMFAEGDGMLIWRELVTLLSGLPGLDTTQAHKFAERFSARSESADIKWQIAVILLSRLLACLISASVRQQSLTEHGYNQDAAASLGPLAELAHLEHWLHVWEKTTRLFQQAIEFNLDRKQVMLWALGIIAGATRDN